MEAEDRKSTVAVSRDSGGEQLMMGITLDVDNRQRNMDAHRLVVEAVNAREVPEALLAPGFHMENRLSAVTDYEYHGATGFADWMNDIFEVFVEDARYEVEEVIAAGEDFVAAMFCITGRGAGSQTPLAFRWAGVTWFRNGRATRAVGYPSRSEALKAVNVEA
jgi:hypothetical protein